jgi:aldose 1-epimerase
MELQAIDGPRKAGDRDGPHLSFNERNAVSVAAPLLLQNGRDRCEIYPAIGGSIGRWSVGDQDMLRVASPDAIDAGDPLGMATFPLVPYSNRIGDAHFSWGGKPVDLAPNFRPEPHAIHGVGWKRCWAVAAHTNQSATLHLSHDADPHWHWPFDAEQEITLGDGVLTLTLRATNRADVAVPLAFGHHPYFDQRHASLHFAAEAVWMSGQDSLPTNAVKPQGQFDFEAAGDVSGRNVDHCYSGINGAAEIRWADRPLRLQISSSPQLPAAVVYVPEGGDAFCFEPVPHINNALNLPGQTPAMPILQPGETTETTITFQVSRQ